MFYLNSQFNNMFFNDILILSMKEVYHGYNDKHVTGKELRELFANCYYCDGRHHDSVRDLTIAEYLDFLGIDDNKEYRLFINEYFCKVLNYETDGDIGFFAYLKLSERHAEKYVCPRCGKNLIPKEGKFGIFRSCIDYPNCKGIVNVSHIGSYEDIKRFGFRGSLCID